MSEQIFEIGSKRTKEEILGIKELSGKPFLPWLRDTILDWGIIVVTMILCAKTHHFLVYLMALFVIGNRQHALAILGHEGTHYTLHANMKLNDFITNLLYFWPVMMTVDGYRRLHFTHHKNTGTTKDPELLHKKARAPQWDLPLNKSKVLGYAVKDLFGYSLPDLLIILTFSSPENKRKLIPVAIMHAAFLTIAIASGYWWISALWYGAMATTFMMFFRFRLWLEHQGTFDTQRVSLTPWQAAIFAPHKIWLHWEHHRFPSVPYHKLEDARRILNGPEPITLGELIRNLNTSAPMPSGAALESIEDKAAG